jgi:hypothetical protein
MYILALGLVLMQVQLGSVGGTVTKPGASEPLAKATVTLAPVISGRLHTAVTEDDGRFTLTNIPPGEYRLSAQNDRYGQVSYGQRKADGPGAILTISPGQKVSDLRISMMPTGAIAGRITARSGEPLVSATVQALRYTYENGRKVLSPAQTTLTDDRGEYRLFWLPAGQYFVAATITGNGASRTTPAMPVTPGANAAANQDQAAIMAQFAMLGELVHATNIRQRILDDGTTYEEAWAAVYYPATTEARQATALDVAAGATRTGIDITMGPARVQSIRGRVVGFAPGSVPTVTLVSQDSSVSRPTMSGKGASTTDGSFAFTGVLPGDYYLAARDPRTALIGSPVSVRVGAGDVDNLILPVGQAISVNGRVRVDGAAEAPRISVILQPTVGLGLFLALPNTPVDASGAFVAAELSPGEYQIDIRNAGGSSAKPLYVKSARLGQTDITGGVHIDANTRDTIEIVLTPDPGSVEGFAIGSRAAPAPNITVVLVPNARKRYDLYKSIVTGIDGRFRFQDLTPGEYKLFAWNDIDTGAWQDPDFIRNHESKGTVVRISEKSNEEVQLNVIY